MTGNDTNEHAPHDNHAATSQASTVLDERGRISCVNLIVLLTEYLEHSLPDDEWAAIDRHLKGCVDCGLYWQQLRETIALTGALREDEVPAPVMESLTGLFLANRSNTA
jgi:hypothetical protein